MQHFDSRTVGEDHNSENLKDAWHCVENWGKPGGKKPNEGK
jgi:hypothetical protein